MPQRLLLPTVTTLCLLYAAPAWACDFLEHSFKLEQTRDELLLEPEIEGYPFRFEIQTGGFDQQTMARGMGALEIGSDVQLITPFMKMLSSWDYIGFDANGKLRNHHDTNPQHPVYGRSGPNSMNFFRQMILYGLAKQYQLGKLPEQAWRWLFLQETLLPLHRQINIAVHQRDQLMFFARLQLGFPAEANPIEQMAFGEKIPTQTLMDLSAGGVGTRRFRTDFLPVDYFMENPFHPDTPVNQLRERTPYVAELGRLFVNSSAPPALREQAKKVGFSLLAEQLRFGGSIDPRQVMLVATSTETAGKLYNQSYGFHEVTKLGEGTWWPLSNFAFDYFNAGGGSGQRRAAPRNDTRTPEVLEPYLNNNVRIRPNAKEKDQIVLHATSVAEFTGALREQGYVLPAPEGQVMNRDGYVENIQPVPPLRAVRPGG